MRNVHTRVVAAPAATVGALLDRLGGPRDVLWPAPVWPPLLLDRPLAVGADGGHGEIRYVVSAYEPGRRVEFRFHPAIGLDGFHALEVEPVDDGHCLIRHVLLGRSHGRMRLLIPLAVRWLHDALIEDLLDNAERAVTGTVACPYRHSAWVRLLLWGLAPRARSASIPAAATLVRAALPRIDYADAYSIDVPAAVSADPSVWADALFTGVPGMADMPRVAETEDEVLLGADEKHLAYRASVFVEDSARGLTATLSSVASLHSRAGRAYFAVVRRFHPFLVRLLLRRAALRLRSDPRFAVPTAHQASVVE